MRSPHREPTAAASTTHNNQSGIPSIPGRPPRHQHRRRPVHRPAGSLLWEYVLPSEVGGRPLEDLILQLEPPILPPQLGKLLLLSAGQPCRAAIVVGVGLGHPIPQARLANPQILGHRSDPFIAHTGKLDSTTTELRR